MSGPRGQLSRGIFVPAEVLLKIFTSLPFEDKVKILPKVSKSWAEVVRMSQSLAMQDFCLDFDTDFMPCKVKVLCAPLPGEEAVNAVMCHDPMQLVTWLGPRASHCTRIIAAGCHGENEICFDKPWGEVADMEVLKLPLFALDTCPHLQDVHWNLPLPNLAAPLFPSLAASLVSLHIRDIDYFYSDCSPSYRLQGMVLTHLTNLTELSLCCRDWVPCWLVQNLRPLINLEQASFEKIDDMESPDVDAMLRSLPANKLTQLSVTGSYDVWRGGRVARSSCRALTHLTALRHLDVSRMMLPRAVSRLSSLGTLVLSEVMCGCPADTQVMLADIAHLTQLDSLFYEAEHDKNFRNELPVPGSIVSCLSSLTALRDLEILTFRAFISVPHQLSNLVSLESLQLGDDWLLTDDVSWLLQVTRLTMICLGLKATVKAHDPKDDELSDDVVEKIARTYEFAEALATVFEEQQQREKGRWLMLDYT